MPPVKDLGLILEESNDVAGALKRRIEKGLWRNMESSLSPRGLPLTQEPSISLHALCTASALLFLTKLRACNVMLHPSFMIQVCVASSGLETNVFTVGYDGGAKRGASSKVS
jgi:hypothetical protein